MKYRRDCRSPGVGSASVGIRPGPAGLQTRLKIRVGVVDPNGDAGRLRDDGSARNVDRQDFSGSQFGQRFGLGPSNLSSSKDKRRETQGGRTRQGGGKGTGRGGSHMVSWRPSIGFVPVTRGLGERLSPDRRAPPPVTTILSGFSRTPASSRKRLAPRRSWPSSAGWVVRWPGR